MDKQGEKATMHAFDMRVPFWVIRLYNLKGDMMLATFKGYSEEAKEDTIEKIKSAWGENIPYTVQEGWE